MRGPLLVILPTLALAACSGNGNDGTVTATGGFAEIGGSLGQGGTRASGTTNSLGGAATGGATGGGVAVGGTSSSGGGNSGGQSTITANSGGAITTGGSAHSGGRSAGGSSASGGIATGGNANSGGSDSAGGRTATGASAYSGGMSSGGSSASTGGNASTGGRTNAGGTGNPTGGASAGASGGVSSGGTSNTGTTDPFVSGTAPAAASYFTKGINLGNRLEAPNEGDWGGKILDTDLAFIASRGFNHVRIPIRFSGHAQASSPFTIDAAFFSRVDAILDQAAQAKLAVILDMHAYDALATSPSGERDRFLSLWSQIATRYRSRPDNVAFELLNEPNGQLDTAWNDLVTAAVQTIRATNPRRLLVVDSVFWADPSRLSELRIPNDANIMASIHFYEPKLFSFQGKSWMGAEYMTTGIIFPGPPASPVTPVAAATAASWAKSWFDAYNTQPAAINPSGPATIASQLAYITSYRSSSGRYVYNGGWGPQDGGEMASRARLVTLVRQECEKAAVGWAIWEDPNNMKLFDSTAKTWVTAIVDALLP
jgi:endoglucanase